MSEEKSMTPAERLLINTETMTGIDDRFFCGIELKPVTHVSQRYIERVVTWYGEINGTTEETLLVYAFLLTLTVDAMRVNARAFLVFERAFDEWYAKIPQPIPAEELVNLGKIVDRDTAAVEAARVDVVAKPKPDAKPEPGAPPD